MNSRLLMIGVLVASAMTSCSQDIPSVAKPKNIPSDAVSAIGADGGAWARCVLETPTHVYCETFHASTGAVWSKGTYVLQNMGQNVRIQSSSQLEGLMSGFSLFDGKTIHLSKGDQLVPDGVIDFPFKIGGKTVEYSFGVETRSEEQYK